MSIIKYIDSFKRLVEHHTKDKYSISSSRRGKIKTAVEQHLSGNASYQEAKKLAQEESYGIQIKHFFISNTEKANFKTKTIEAEFKKILNECRLDNCKINVQSLLKCKNLSDSSHGEYQKMISNIYFESSDCKSEISDLSYDANTKKMTIKLAIANKQTNKTDIQSYSCNIKSDNFERILAEHAIFKHRQYGIEITDDRIKNYDIVKKYLVIADKYRYDALILFGGGAKGGGYSGILNGLGEYRLKNVQYVSGASAGALTNALIAVGIKPFEFEELIATNNLKLSQEQLITFLKENLFAIVKKRLEEFEKNKTNKPDDTQSELIMQYCNSGGTTDITFKQLNELKSAFPNIGFKDIFLSSTLANSNLPVEVELSANTCPDMPISLAAAASAALPVLYTPVDITQYVSNDYKEVIKKAGALTKADKIMVNDGGQINNAPYQYIAQKCNHPLTLGFVCNKEIYKKDSSITDYMKNVFLGLSVYDFRRADVRMLEENNRHMFYLTTKGVTLTAFESASRIFVKLIDSIKNEFIMHESDFIDIGDMPAKNKLGNLSPEELEILKRLKFEIYPKYYSGDYIERRVLEYKISEADLKNIGYTENNNEIEGKSYFEALHMIKDTTQFNLLLNIIKIKISDEIRRKNQILHYQSARFS